MAKYACTAPTHRTPQHVIKAIMKYKEKAGKQPPDDNHQDQTREMRRAVSAKGLPPFGVKPFVLLGALQRISVGLSFSYPCESIRVL